jgi:hypothetical protein
MTFRCAAVLAFLLLLGGARPALAADPVQPRPGTLISGKIRFPRAEAMTILTDRRDGSKLTVALGFDGDCKGGNLGEVWAARIPTRETVRVRNGAFSATLTGQSRDFGGVTGRTVAFRWRLAGAFTDAATATATVSGTAEVRAGGKVISRCEIAKPAVVKLTEGG